MGDEALSAGAVARRLGVAVTTLRTWHQRYGLGPSRHVPGRHRRYTPQDLRRLEVMLRLTAQGVAPAEAAAWARRTPASTPTSSSARLNDSSHAAQGLARAAMRLDTTAMREILSSAVASWNVTGAWTDVAMPVLIGIGSRHQATDRYVEVEHLLSRCVTEAFGAVPRPGGGPARVLLAAADEEQHTLPLEALAAALAEAGIPSRLLGGRVPPRALAEAIARTGPQVVVLWSQTPETGDESQLTRVAGRPHPPPLLAAAGPGWPAELPPGVVHLTSLTEAVDLVRAAVA